MTDLDSKLNKYKMNKKVKNYFINICDTYIIVFVNYYESLDISGD